MTTARRGDRPGQLQEKPTVEAIIVNWNSGDDLERVVKELRKQRSLPPIRVLVVDNASTDGSLERALEALPDLEFIQAGSNRGYTGGNNLGFSHLGMDSFVLIVNPDVRLTDPETVVRLADALLADPGLAAVAPMIVDENGEPEHTKARIDLRTALIETVWDESQEGIETAQDWLVGACFLARAPVIRDLGGFDDRYFLFGDEVDLAIRLRAAGWRLGLVKCATVTHQRSSSFGSSRKALYYYWRNLYLLCSLHAPGRFVWRAAWAARLLKNAFDPRSRRTPWRGRMRPMIAGARDALWGRFGPGPEDRVAGDPVSGLGIGTTAMADGRWPSSSILRRSSRAQRRNHLRSESPESR